MSVAPDAQVAELVDALVSGTSGESRGGSSPLLGTNFQNLFCRQVPSTSGLLAIASAPAPLDTPPPPHHNSPPPHNRKRHDDHRLPGPCLRREHAGSPVGHRP